MKYCTLDKKSLYLHLMDVLKKQINEECLYKLPQELLDRLLASTTEVVIKPRHTLINYGRLDDNIYIPQRYNIKLTSVFTGS